MKNEENKIENETLTLWIARDGNGALYVYENKPRWQAPVFSVTRRNEYEDYFCLDSNLYPSIKPGEYRRATVVLDDEKPLTAAEESVIQHFKN
jgi:hypothetical protein